MAYSYDYYLRQKSPSCEYVHYFFITNNERIKQQKVRNGVMCVLFGSENKKKIVFLYDYCGVRRVAKIKKCSKTNQTADSLKTICTVVQ